MKTHSVTSQNVQWLFRYDWPNFYVFYDAYVYVFWREIEERKMRASKDKDTLSNPDYDRRAFQLVKGSIKIDPNI